MKAARFAAATGLGFVLATPPILALGAPGPIAAVNPGAVVGQKGGQQAVAIDQLPAAVTAAIQKTYPGSTIVSAAKVTRGAQVRYELSVKTTADAQPIAVTASADGLIRTGAKGAPAATPAPAAGKPARKNAAPAPQPQGETVAVGQLPKVIVQAIKDAYPKDSIIDAMRIASGSQLLYQLTLSDVSHALPMLVFVTSDGKIQKR